MGALISRPLIQASARATRYSQLGVLGPERRLGLDRSRRNLDVPTRFAVAANPRAKVDADDRTFIREGTAVGVVSRADLGSGARPLDGI